MTSEINNYLRLLWFCNSRHKLHFKAIISNAKEHFPPRQLNCDICSAIETGEVRTFNRKTQLLLKTSYDPSKHKWVSYSICELTNAVAFWQKLLLAIFVLFVWEIQCSNDLVLFSESKVNCFSISPRLTIFKISYLASDNCGIHMSTRGEIISSIRKSC